MLSPIIITIDRFIQISTVLFWGVFLCHLFYMCFFPLLLSFEFFHIFYSILFSIVIFDGTLSIYLVLTFDNLLYVLNSIKKCLISLFSINYT